MSVAVFIGNLSFDVAPFDVERLCTPYGHIIRISIPPPKREGVSHRGFCFVEYANEADADRAIEGLNRKIFFDQPLRALYAHDSSRK